METKNELIVRPGEAEITVIRLINAPRELVFRAWTEPEHLKHWWGPEGFTTTTTKMEFREGGTWEGTMHGPDGKDYPGAYEYVEIIRNEKIVLKHKTPPAFQITVTFEKEGNKTRLSFTNRFPTAEARDLAIKNVGAAEGLKQNVDKMERFLSEKPSGKELVITKELNAPKDLVYEMWTRKEHLQKWWGPKGVDIKVTHFDLKPGGTFLYCMVLPDGGEMWGIFVYHEIVPAERMVFVNSFSNKDGEITRAPFSTAWPLEVYNELTFNEKDGKTIVVLKGGPIHATEEERKTFESGFESMNEGFAGTFEQLENYLLEIKQ